ncbi:hypothetical protein HHK36_011433 [Tetracentron sinense]|uniref:NAC domain-containing protein n=1 Tax=Tetracentron sinense TaxID=13715 RepID=A0A834ZBT6_TETSI|nr:hypothetical protein HHK36_011433 [Tetracentron sinense]
MEDLRPGFRFYPTEEELISFYLLNKLEGKRQELDRVIPVVDIYKQDPWHLSQLSGERCRGDPEQWFFFTPRQEREARGRRPNRTAVSGYWKASGSPSYVYSSSNRIIGVKKIMVFYKGKAPTGRKTKWKMIEYRAIDSSSAIPKLRHEISLCRVYVNSGCLRAFDRRPSAATTMETTIHRAHNDGATTSQQNPPPVEKTNSPDNLFSGENDNPPQTEESTNWDMFDFLQPGEWEELGLMNTVSICSSD